MAYCGDAGFPYVSVSFSSAIDLISDIHDYFEHSSNDRYTSHLESFLLSMLFHSIHVSCPLYDEKLLSVRKDRESLKPKGGVC